MATDNAATKGKKRKQYLPHNKAVKKKGSYPLHPGVQGFFITCDGGRECQACFEAINVLDTFYDELVNGSSGKVNLSELSSKPVNKKIKFAYSDDEEEEGDEKGKVEDEEDGNGEKVKVEDKPEGNDVKCETQSNGETNIPAAVIESNKEETEEKSNNEEEEARKEATEPPVKKQCTETKDSEDVNTEKVAEKSIDKLIEEELKELGDKSKRDGDPSPKDVAQLMMTSAASTKKHMSRFLLRVLPIEVSCYPSEEDISRAVAPVFAKYFPADASEPQKFAVMYGARANSGLDRAKVINAVAKSVPSPHKVDLSNPDKTIVVEIVKTVCLIGVVEKYKELAKYNLRQLTSPPPTTAVEPKAEDN
ncbi:THUMP domain-containing protein 1 homolog [Linum perenne]